jgi:hypothetical protein
MGNDDGGMVWGGRGLNLRMEGMINAESLNYIVFYSSLFPLCPFSRKRRKGVTTSKDFDHNHHHLGSGPTAAMIGGNGLLYEDLTHARPRPPIATPSIEVTITLILSDT